MLSVQDLLVAQPCSMTLVMKRDVPQHRRVTVKLAAAEKMTKASELVVQSLFDSWTDAMTSG